MNKRRRYLAKRRRDIAVLERRFLARPMGSGSALLQTEADHARKRLTELGVPRRMGAPGWR